MFEQKIHWTKFLYLILVAAFAIVIVAMTLDATYNIAISYDAIQPDLELDIYYKSNTVNCKVNINSEGLQRQDLYDWCPYVLGIVNAKLNWTNGGGSYNP